MIVFVQGFARNTVPMPMKEKPNRKKRMQTVGRQWSCDRITVKDLCGISPWLVSFDHEQQPDGLSRTTSVKIDELVNKLGIINFG